MSKQCYDCGATKPMEEFVKSKSSAVGRANQCKSCKNARARMISDEQRERNNACSRRWRANNKRAVAKNNRRWKEENRALATAKQNKRHASQKQRTVSWANEQLIASYYKEAKRLEELTGIQFHVDHIIPLQGELVSGLHVETNLQLLPAHENLGKSNSFDPMTFCA